MLFFAGRHCPPLLCTLVQLTGAQVHNWSTATPVTPTRHLSPLADRAVGTQNKQQGQARSKPSGWESRLHHRQKKRAMHMVICHISAYKHSRHTPQAL